MSQSSPSAGGGTVKTKALSAKAASFYPSSSSTHQQQPCSQSFTSSSSAPSPGAAAVPAPAAGASTASTTSMASGTGAGANPSSPSATSQQHQSQSSSAASPSPKQQQHQSAWGGLRVRTYSDCAGTMGTAASVGDTSAAIDHFSEYLYDHEDYEVSSQEVRVAMDQQSQEGMHQQYQQGQHGHGYYDDQINSDIEAEMDRDQDMTDMEGLVVAMNGTSGVRAGGSGIGGGRGGGGGDIGSSAHEYWFPECRDCGCCRGYKYGCVCVQGGVSTMCKCTSVLESANDTDDKSGGESSKGQQGDEGTGMDMDTRYLS